MKTTVLFLFATLLSLQMSVAQKQPVFPRLSGSQYYSEDTLLNFLKSGTEKSNQFSAKFSNELMDQYLRKGKSPVTNDLDSIFKNYVEIQEIHLRAKIDTNSLWNVQKNALENFLVSTDYDGPGYVYNDQVNGVYFAFVKGNCLNFVKVTPTIIGEKKPTILTTFGLKPVQNQFLPGFGNFSQQQAIPPVIVNVNNTNTNDFGPLIEALGKMNQLPAQPAVDLKLPAVVVEKKSLSPWVPIIIGSAVTLGTGAGLYFLLRDKGGPVGAPGHGDGGPVGAPGHGDGGLKLLFRFGL